MYISDSVMVMTDNAWVRQVEGEECKRDGFANAGNNDTRSSATAQSVGRRRRREDEERGLTSHELRISHAAASPSEHRHNFARPSGETEWVSDDE
jgi:hypothetical protein